jgi:hydroxyacylglutathione hydrolase
METTKGNKIIQLLSGRSNVFLVKHYSGNSMLVDTGVKLVRRFLTDALIKYQTPRPHYLVLTHSHFDHAANAAFIRKTTGAKTVIHEAEADYLRTGGMKIPEGTYAFTRTLVSLAHKVNYKPGSEPCTVDVEVVGAYNPPDMPGIKLIHTPGHSAGSISIIVDNEIALVGDTMVNVGLFNVFPPFADDVEALKQSWQKLLETGCHSFLPSHGGVISRGELESKIEVQR